MAGIGSLGKCNILNKLSPFSNTSSPSWYEEWDGIEYYVISDGTESIRRGIRDGDLVTDITITELGFDGIEDTDWVCLEYEPFIIT